MSYALITGASSGIGYELAKIFAMHGHNLVLVARRKDKLDRLAGELEQKCRVKAHAYISDLSRPDSVHELHSWVKKNDLCIDFLVNNAGFVVYGSFSGTPWEDEQRMMHLHMDTTTLMIKLFLPGMLKRTYGKILNVGSTGSFVPGPYIAVYCATKSYILSLSEALAEELKGSGVTVTALCPGGTKTEFESRAVRKNKPTEPWGMEAGKVARIAYRAMIKGKRVVIPGLQNRIQVFAIRFLPRALVSGWIKRRMSANK
jgi:short-subunit dehydrogenase